MTKHILRIDASARKEGSITRQLTDRIIDRFDEATLTTRDLTEALPQIDESWVGANFTPADDRSDVQKAALELSDSLIAEVQAADTVVIGIPVYNFGVPAAFKAWVDLVARAGVTFRYTENGPEGLLEGKRAIVVFASGGVPLGSEADFASGFVRHVLGFIGIHDVEFVAADAMAKDAGATLKAANDAVDVLAA